MQCHTNGGQLEWCWESHDRMSDAFADIAGDRDIKVVIHTGTGETYNALLGQAGDRRPEAHVHGVRRRQERGSWSWTKRRGTAA